jgi:hypothetical protein
MKSLDLLLRSDYSPGECLAKLAEQMDVDRLTLFSFSGYRGKKPILGRIAGNEFRLHKRRYWHNGFGPVLYGRVRSDGQGAVIEAYWDMAPVARASMQIWLIFAGLIGALIFFRSLMQLLGRKTPVYENLWIGLVVSPAMILFGLYLPRLGAQLSFHERKHVLELLNRALVAAEARFRARKGTGGRCWLDCGRSSGRT